MALVRMSIEGHSLTRFLYSSVENTIRHHFASIMIFRLSETSEIQQKLVYIFCQQFNYFVLLTIPGFIDGDRRSSSVIPVTHNQLKRFIKHFS